MHVGFFAYGVIGLTSRRYMGQRFGFTERGADFAVIAQPCFKVGDGTGLIEPGFQLFENRGKLRRIG